MNQQRIYNDLRPYTGRRLARRIVHAGIEVERIHAALCADAEPTVELRDTLDYSVSYVTAAEQLAMALEAGEPWTKNKRRVQAIFELMRVHAHGERLKEYAEPQARPGVAIHLLRLRKEIEKAKTAKLRPLPVAWVMGARQRLKAAL